MTLIAGIEIPSTAPIFLAIVGLHIAVALACLVAGAAAVLSPKAPARHPTFGTIYCWCLAVVFASATAVAVMHWKEDYRLFLLGTLAFGVASAGRAARHNGLDWDPISELHKGQRSDAPHRRAGHMTAADHIAGNSLENPRPRGPSTYDFCRLAERALWQRRRGIAAHFVIPVSP